MLLVTNIMSVTWVRHKTFFDTFSFGPNRNKPNKCIPDLGMSLSLTKSKHMCRSSLSTFHWRIVWWGGRTDRNKVPDSTTCKPMIRQRHNSPNAPVTEAKHPHYPWPLDNGCSTGYIYIFKDFLLYDKFGIYHHLNFSSLPWNPVTCQRSTSHWASPLSSMLPLSSRCSFSLMSFFSSSLNNRRGWEKTLQRQQWLLKSARIWGGEAALFFCKITSDQTGTMGPGRTWAGRGNKVRLRSGKK